MKNANVFLLFVLIVLLIYPVSIFSYNKSKKIDIPNEPVLINNFSYKIIDNKGEEILIEGTNLTKYSDKQVIENPKGYFINSKNKKINFKADMATNSLLDELIELRNNIEISENNNFLKTELIIFDRKSNTLFAPNYIKIFFNNSFIEGNELTYNMEDKKITLKNTRGKLWLSKTNF
jgi:LPS export ABC transporter protein LptC